VQAHVTSNDELVSSVDGLECLILQAVFHVNAGNPRRAWLSFRRALNIAQMIGIHRSTSTIEGGKNLWNQILHGDRYLVGPKLRNQTFLPNIANRRFS